MTQNTQPYAVTIGGQKADPYRILQAYGITNPWLQHSIKKLLRAGKSHKTLKEDVEEVILSLQRGLEMLEEDSRKVEIQYCDTGDCPICGQPNFHQPHFCTHGE